MISAYRSLAPDRQALCDTLDVVNDLTGLLDYLSGQGRIQQPVPASGRRRRVALGPCSSQVRA